MRQRPARPKAPPFAFPLTRGCAGGGHACRRDFARGARGGGSAGEKATWGGRQGGGWAAWGHSRRLPPGPAAAAASAARSTSSRPRAHLLPPRPWRPSPLPPSLPPSALLCSPAGALAPGSSRVNTLKLQRACFKRSDRCHSMGLQGSPRVAWSEPRLHSRSNPRFHRRTLFSSAALFRLALTTQEPPPPRRGPRRAEAGTRAAELKPTSRIFPSRKSGDWGSKTPLKV